MKKLVSNWLARKIARTMLFIKATTFKKLTEEPYKWACGMSMRIYNDNRMMLGNFKHRLRIARGFIKLIHEEGIHPDFIIGTMTSGIAPAASVAQFLKKKLLINYKGEYFIFEPKLWNKEVLKVFENEGNNPNLIISTSPFAIPHGVQYANKLGIGFAYTREAKDHGKKQPIEGIIKPGMRFIYVHEEIQGEKIRELIKALEEEFNLKCVGSLEITHGYKKVLSADEITGKVAVTIEDLFSTGGSSAVEVHEARQAGLICNHCFSIFSYDFKCSKKQYSGEMNISKKDFKLSEPCEIDSLLLFPVLLEEIKRLKFYPPEVIKEMENEIGGFDERYEAFLAEKEKV